MKKTTIISVVALSLLALFFLLTPGKTRLKSYYSGDAISYNRHLYIASTNTGSLEIFKASDTLEPILIAKVKNYNSRFHAQEEFSSAKFAIEGSGLYVYAVSGYTLAKYQLINDHISLVKEVKNTYWEWYNKVDIFGSDLVTISAQGITIYNRNLETIVKHDFANPQAPDNITSTHPDYYLSINNETQRIEVYDKASRTIKVQIPINLKYDNGNRQAYQDRAGNIYVVDDYYTKKFNLNGQLITSFRHLDYQGFAVTASPLNGDIYFSNGVGVVKLDSNLAELGYIYTNNLTELGPNSGAWAMGLKVVNNNGDKVVVFNNSNILILDGNNFKQSSYRTLGVIKAKEEADLVPLQNLYLNLDKPRATINASVLVSGGGYIPFEQIQLSFADESVTIISADASGSFSTITTIPSINPGYYDFKAQGLLSGLHYSTSFQVVK